jgi:phenylacetate-coenzyme A ligase PaaK-like adenylate-forming protein/arsenate reductase-like glutaredoxin family protein
MSTTHSDTAHPHYWFGTPISSADLLQHIAQLDIHLGATLGKPFSTDQLLHACERMADAIAREDNAYTELVEQAAIAVGNEEAQSLVASLPTMLRRPFLETKLRSELGSVTPSILERRYPGRQYEAWLPAGCVVHVMPSNVLIAAAMGLLESLLLGNINIVKLGSRDTGFTTAFARLLASYDNSGQLRDFMAVLHLSSKDQAPLQQLFDHADVISAWGGESAIAAVRRTAPTHTKVISWGHKVSFGYVAASHLHDQATIDAIARDVCRLDQQACSSPQTVLVETGTPEALHAFANQLAEALARIAPTIPGATPSDAEQAEITTARCLVSAQQALGLTSMIEDPNGQWRVFIDQRTGLSPSPLYRSIWVKPVKRDTLGQTLRPMRQWLQTCGLAADIHAYAGLTRQLLAAGVSRITRAGEMIDSYTGAPHDGVYALQQLARRISVDAPDTLKHVGSFAQLETAAPVLLAADTPIMTKVDFQRHLPEHNTQPVGLIVRSGGSSGQPAYSTFTWTDYARQMAVASHGLVAAGLEPQTDRVMNLFASGYMYGSFISFWTILEHLGVEQLPMAMVPEYDLIAEQIVAHKVNVLIGMTPHLMGLMAIHGKELKVSGHLKKLYYGGESLSSAQHRFLTEECGLEIVRSVAYGSNDAGPIGYQCEHSHGSVHHVFSDLQQMEIVDADCDAPVGNNDIGRILLTSKARCEPVIERYEIGDMGRWVHEPCPCGRTDPRFELAGRIGDVFKAGSPLLNYATFIKLFAEGFNYTGPLQIHIDSEGPNTLIHLWTDASLNSPAQAVLDYLFGHYGDLAVCQQLLLPVIVTVETHTDDAFVRNKASGKLRHVCDHRIAQS